MNNEIVYYINGTPILRKHINSLPYNPALRQRSVNLKKAGNYPEVVFWQHVHKGKFHNIDFDRQRIIGNYIVDFYIKSLGIIIEIDGTSHNDKDVYDEKRESWLRTLGLKFFRISYLRVLHDIGNVMKELEDFIVQHHSDNKI